jgi:hypothetical protein
MRGVKKRAPEKTGPAPIRIVHVRDPRPGMTKLACGVVPDLAVQRGHEIAKPGDRILRRDLCLTCALFARWEGFEGEVVAP